MSEKSLRGAGPEGDQAGNRAAPAASGGRSPDSGGTPIEPWGGERTDRVSGREGSGARVALVPATGADGQVDRQASVADTRRVADSGRTIDSGRVADSGRTTLMGVPSPVASQPDKPTTSPGHDVHLPSEKARVADARPVTASGGSHAVELDPSSLSGDKSQPRGNERGAKTDQSDKFDKAERKDSTPGGAEAPNERTMAAAAATFRAAIAAGDQPAAAQTGEPEHQHERSWAADRTQEFGLDMPPARGGFAKALAAGIALAVGTGVLVVGFVHQRVHGGAELGEVAHSTRPSPVVPVPLPPPPLPENPLPPEAMNPTNAPANVAPQPAGPEAPSAAGALDPQQQPSGSTGEMDQATKTDRRVAQRAKAATPAGRTAPSARTPRATTTVVRPGLMPLPSAPPPVSPPVAAAPTAPPALTAPQPEKPAVRPEAPKSETGKPYDPDMPLPPSTE